MSLITYFKEITIGWKLSVFAVVFCVWPISAYLIFHFHPLLFSGLELSKLTLLSSAIATPFMVVNTCVSFLLTSPRDPDLKWGNSADELLSGTVLIGIGVTLWVLSFGAIAALLDCNLRTVQLIIGCIEVAFLIVTVVSKIIEDKRFKFKQLSSSR